ncbi:hypothetical protein [Candidatus Poriferisodalis sp.]|uniref:hypothetical protein n=1 Tax=Candidatus Poriferisodalis sp. TaxID=3101277 RepID=UPI003D0FC707
MSSKRTGRRVGVPMDTDSETHDAVEAGVARFVDAVEAVRSRTTGQLLVAARAIVYGLPIAAAAAGVIVLGAIAAVRALDIAVPGEVWSAHLIASGVFGVAGAWTWSKRRPSEGRKP